MEELCTLASSGNNRSLIIAIAITLICVGILCSVRKKLNFMNYFSIFISLVLMVSIGLASTAHAAGTGCATNSSETNPAPHSESEELLIDNTYTVLEDDIVRDSEDDPINTYARFSVISNDLATESDPIDPTSVRLVSENINNQPEWPNATKANIPNPENPGTIIGQWSLELDCTDDCTDSSSTTGYIAFEV